MQKTGGVLLFAALPDKMWINKELLITKVLLGVLRDWAEHAYRVTPEGSYRDSVITLWWNF